MPPQLYFLWRQDWADFRLLCVFTLRGICVIIASAESNEGEIEIFRRIAARGIGGAKNSLRDSLCAFRRGAA